MRLLTHLINIVTTFIIILSTVTLGFGRVRLLGQIVLAAIIIGVVLMDSVWTGGVVVVWRGSVGIVLHSLCLLFLFISFVISIYIYVPCIGIIDRKHSKEYVYFMHFLSGK